MFQSWCFSAKPMILQIKSIYSSSNPVLSQWCCKCSPTYMTYKATSFFPNLNRNWLFHLNGGCYVSRVVVPWSFLKFPRLPGSPVNILGQIWFSRWQFLNVSWEKHIRNRIAYNPLHVCGHRIFSMFNHYITMVLPWFVRYNFHPKPATLQGPTNWL